MNSMNIKPWVPGEYPIPFFQTWCSTSSSVTPSMLDDNDIWSGLKNAGLPPKMYECVRGNLVLNNVGVDCIIICLMTMNVVHLLLGSIPMMFFMHMII